MEEVDWDVNEKAALTRLGKSKSFYIPISRARNKVNVKIPALSLHLTLVIKMVQNLTARHVILTS